eukprot:m.21893 g.21893  ORF g.21893 m.21893 type:complete len:203 (+) comp8771_c0_seq1:114-722(+)
MMNAGDDGILGGDSSSTAELSFSEKLFRTMITRYRVFRDAITPMVVPRWVFFGLSLVAFAVRIWTAEGWYIVAYGLGIFLLSQLIDFLTPRFNPASIDLDSKGEDEDEMQLPTTSKDDEEFRPFVRKLPEWKFWMKSQVAIFVALALTLTQQANIPVFWPILVLYFFILLTLTMKERIAHMIKYKYVPFSVGKPKHKGKSSD